MRTCVFIFKRLIYLFLIPQECWAGFLCHKNEVYLKYCLCHSCRGCHLLKLGKILLLFINCWVRFMLLIPFIKQAAVLSNIGFRANWAVYFIETLFFHFLTVVTFLFSLFIIMLVVLKARLIPWFSFPLSGYFEQYGCIPHIQIFSQVCFHYFYALAFQT